MGGSLMITEELRLATAGTEWVLEKHTWHQKKLGAPTFGICQKSIFQREMAKAWNSRHFSHAHNGII